MSRSSSFTLASILDIDKVSQLELSSFPADESASPETVRDRQQNAGKYFIVAKDEESGEITGFINGTCIEGNCITHESMLEHHPEGNSLVIHSVTVSAVSRRKGLGSTMLKWYIAFTARECPEIRKVLLLSKAYLLHFYVSCGFSLIGLSSVEHGNVR
jgi:N-acetylglutamate synthase-like GNAT family acetyltransferase